MPNGDPNNSKNLAEAVKQLQTIVSEEKPVLSTSRVNTGLSGASLVAIGVLYWSFNQQHADDVTARAALQGQITELRVDVGTLKSITERLQQDVRQLRQAHEQQQGR